MKTGTINLDAFNMSGGTIRTQISVLQERTSRPVQFTRITEQCPVHSKWQVDCRRASAYNGASAQDFNRRGSLN